MAAEPSSVTIDAAPSTLETDDTSQSSPTHQNTTSATTSSGPRGKNPSAAGDRRHSRNVLPPLNNEMGSWVTEEKQLLLNTLKELILLLEYEQENNTGQFGMLFCVIAARIDTFASYRSFLSSDYIATPTVPDWTVPATGLDRVHHPSSPNVERVTKQCKIPVPETPGYNFIGRILGPRGISVRQLESRTGCGILIRGKGSIKNAEREEYLRQRNAPGFEHLKEPLHVLITAEGYDEAECERKLDNCKRRIQALLQPEYDEYKRNQLTQLAMINGTFSPRD